MSNVSLKLEFFRGKQYTLSMTSIIQILDNAVNYDVYRETPYEHDSTAPVGQMIFIESSDVLVSTGVLFRNQYSSPQLPDSFNQ
jgi:hypothetical protein